jgi:hypothetical protein
MVAAMAIWTFQLERIPGSLRVFRRKENIHEPLFVQVS